MHTYETEVLGTLTKVQFDKEVVNLEQLLGKPKHVKRLSLQITDYARKDLDTRIRITNGEAEIMQKVGDWNAITRKEISVPLTPKADVVYGYWEILNHMLNAPTTQKRIIQMENYLFVTSDYEIKLTHQHGKLDAYNFEVESFRNETSPVNICKKYGLTPNLEPKDAAYWEAFNEQVNLDIRAMNGEQLLGVISQYCK